MPILKKYLLAAICLTLLAGVSAQDLNREQKDLKKVAWS